MFTVTYGTMFGSGTFINNGAVVINSSQQMGNVAMYHTAILSFLSFLMMLRQNYGSIQVMSGITTTIGGGGLIAGTLQIGNNAEVGLGGRYSIYFYFIFLSLLAFYIFCCSFLLSFIVARGASISGNGTLTSTGSLSLNGTFRYTIPISSALQNIVI